MNITVFQVTSLQTNCYLVENDGEGIVIDPGADAETIFKKAQEDGVKIVAIMLTHGHFDHAGGVSDLKALTNAKIYVSKEDEELANSIKSLSFALGGTMKKFSADKYVSDGEKLTVAGLDFAVIATPGHTSGGVCYDFGDILFTGDTLFELSFGRTDFPTGNSEELKNSIVNKLFLLDGDKDVLPGHGESTTLNFERQYNPIREEID